MFAKTDIQPLINDGAKQSDIAGSIFQSVDNQTISGDHDRKIIVCRQHFFEYRRKRCFYVGIMSVVTRMNEFAALVEHRRFYSGGANVRNGWAYRLFKK